MKRIIFILMILILTAAGCASRQVVQSDRPAEKAAAAQTMPEQKASSSGKATSGDNIREGQMTDNRAIKELQSKLKDAYFDFDQYSLNGDAKSAVKELATVLSKHPMLKVAIEGNCDERGTTEYNISLGEKRAEAVKQYLSSLGISAGRIETTSYGKEKPVCNDHNESCWSKNRRAHSVLN